MPEAHKYHVDDWVRFQFNGEIVIGVVQYLKWNGSGCAYLVTDAGTIRPDDVLERRAPAADLPQKDTP